MNILKCTKLKHYHCLISPFPTHPITTNNKPCNQGICQNMQTKRDNRTTLTTHSVSKENVVARSVPYSYAKTCDYANSEIKWQNLVEKH